MYIFWPDGKSVHIKPESGGASRNAPSVAETGPDGRAQGKTGRLISEGG